MPRHPFALLCLAAAAGASRVVIDSEERAARAAAWAGQVLRGRYRLLELPGGNSSEESSKPRALGDFPWGRGKGSPLGQGRFAEPAELGRGKFGEAWRALDVETGEEVVVKIFHMYSSYVTKRMMGTDKAAAAVVEEGDEECKLVQRMLASESSYPQGKSHICKCLASHVGDQVHDDDVSFLVLEQCGQSLQSKVMAQWEQPQAAFFEDARRWMTGVLAAVRFMSGLRRPMMHMDIHYGNVVINEESEAKLIDFGYSQAFDEPFPEVLHFRAAPEHVWAPDGTMAQYPKERAWAYDVWSTGVVYWTLLCDRQSSFFFFTSNVKKQEGFREGRSHFRCNGGFQSSGEDRDWAAVDAALTDYEHRKSPKEIMAMLA